MLSWESSLSYGEYDEDASGARDGEAFLYGNAYYVRSIAINISRVL